MIETTEPAEASISARIESLAKACRTCIEARKQSLEQAQRMAEEALRLEGAINELNRWRSELWGNAQGEE